MLNLEMVAIKPLRYAGRLLKAGDTFHAKHKKDALILIYRRKADYFIEEPKPAPKPAAKKTAAKKPAAKTKKKDLKAAAPAGKATGKKTTVKSNWLETSEDDNEPAAEESQSEKGEAESTTGSQGSKGEYERRDMRAKK